ncbi:unnamed protein product [Rotaria sp. Silwood1]|nr:unnamed protein product [Rotaria sp. Silwood1]CAF4873235.1 unnamed protein product [Rotaria sp. Silwood1]
MSTDRWFVFDELVMGSDMMCQRCIQPTLQLPGGVKMNGSRLFRDRMYIQHGLIPPILRPIKILNDTMPQIDSTRINSPGTKP